MIRDIATHRAPGARLSQHLQHELFADELPGSQELAAGSEAGLRSSRSSSRSDADRHLAAARRLARAIRRLPDHSAEQTRAGQAICRHLIALLEESA